MADKEKKTKQPLAQSVKETTQKAAARVKEKRQQLTTAVKEKKQKNFRPNMIVSITDRGASSKLVKIFKIYDAFYNTVCLGAGTASSDILDILGLENSEKDVVISIMSEPTAITVMKHLNDRLSGNVGSKGISFRLKLNAAPGLLVKALEIKTNKSATEGFTVNEESTKYNLIIVTVNQGFTDEVMAAAKKAGARGGTLLRARQVRNDETDSLFGNNFTPEREIIAILTPNETRNAIIEAINTDFGVRSEANSVVLSMPVEDVAKLS